MKTKTGLPRLSLFALAWPMLIEELTGGITSFTDTLFVSMLSDEAAASVGMLGPVLGLGYFILPQFTAAGTSVAAQYMGAGQDDKVKAAWSANILFSTISGGLLALFVYLVSGKIGLWLGMTEAQNAWAEAYLSVIAVNFLVVGLRNSFASILASKTLTHWNMAASIVTNLLNIPLNWAFMTGWGIFPEWGVRGIAFATVLSFLAGTSILFILVRFKLGVLLGGRLDGQLSFRHRAKEIREAAVPILKIGVPAALEPFSYTMQSFIVSAVLIRFGTVAMAANTYANKYIFLDMAVSWSLTAGGQILMSHHLGAGNIEQVRKTWWRIAAIASSFAFAVILVIYLFRGFFMSFFTSAPEILALASTLVLFSLFMEPIRSINILGGVALKTVGDGLFSVIIALMFMWGLVPVILLAARAGYGIIGLWACLLLDETIRAGINLWRWNSGRWTGKTVIGNTSGGAVAGASAQGE